MKFSRPKWLCHDPEKIKSTHLYSLSFHPKEPKLATASSDYYIKIWNTSGLNKKLENNEEVESAVVNNSKRLLATLTHHSGSVLCVRFSNLSGKYLASASDDKVVLIWQLDTENPPSPPGTPNDDSNPIRASDVIPNVEHWKAVKRLTGQYMDIVDLSWSSNNSYLATASLDNSVFIYSGTDFELTHKIEAHSGFVKGISFDPLGRYLATSSDDKSVKIFKINTWEEVTSLQGDGFPFTTSSIFRRLDWSPDGNHLVSPNVLRDRKDTACLVSSSTWRPEIWFLGHLRTVTAVKYNPFLFKQPNETYVQVLALGSLDNLITIWKTGQREPLVCFKSVFGSFVTDFSWSADGMVLVASSFEGTSCCMTFMEKELGIPTSYAEFSGLPPQEDLQLHIDLINEDSNTNKTVNVLTAFRVGSDGKKRFQLGATSNSITSEIPTTPNSILNRNNVPITTPSISITANKSTSTAITKPTVCIPTDHTQVPSTSNGNTTIISPRVPRPPTGLTATVLQTQQPSQNPDYQISLKNLIPVPTTSKIVKYSPANSVNIAVEIKNQAPIKQYSVISCYENGTLVWNDILKSDCIVYGANEFYHYLGCKNQELIIYGPNGTKILPPLKLDGIPCFIAIDGHFLACLTNNGIIYCWDLAHQLTVVSPSSIAYLLLPGNSKVISLSSRVTNLGIQSMGAPYICLHSGASYIYNISFRTWVTMTEPFFSKLDLNPTNSLDPPHKKVKLPPIKLTNHSKPNKAIIKLDTNIRKIALTSYLHQSFQTSFLWDDEESIITNFKLYIANLFENEQFKKILDICKIVFDRQNRVLAPDKEIIELGIKLIESIKPIIKSKSSDYPLNFLIKLIRDKKQELKELTQ